MKEEQKAASNLILAAMELGEELRPIISVVLEDFKQAGPIVGIMALETHIFALEQMLKNSGMKQEAIDSLRMNIRLTMSQAVKDGKK